MTDSATPRDEETQSYSVTYCENCGQLAEASEEIGEAVEEPVHRIDIIEAIGEFDEVGETVAEEIRECECTGQIVKRWYVYPLSAVPEPDYDPDPSQFSGRDPDADALIALSVDPDPDDYQELREVLGLDAGGSER